MANNLAEAIRVETARPLPALTPAKPVQGSKLLSALDILTADYPAPVWVVPDLLSSGLAFLGGRPKVGKSWLALQLAFAVTSGGYFLGRPVKQGRVLFLALEDSKRRFQLRMLAQDWTADAAANMDVMTLDEFRKQIGFLHMRGAPEHLSSLMERGGYSLVVVDTFSRAFSGLRDLDKAEVITPALSPLQEITVTRDCLILFIDHNRKSLGLSPNPVDDLMSSTAKTAVADTLAGLYRDDNGTKKLMVTGRDIEELTLLLKWDRLTACYQVIEDETAGLNLSPREAKVYQWLKANDRGRQVDISKGTDIPASNLTSVLRRMVVGGFISFDTSSGVYSIGEVVQ